MMTSHLPEPHYRLRCTGCADEPVVINLTGGGRARAARELPNVPPVPDLFAAPSDLQSIPERVARLAERRAAYPRPTSGGFP
jgi:hypothetical protein